MDTLSPVGVVYSTVLGPDSIFGHLSKMDFHKIATVLGVIEFVLDEEEK